MGYLEVGFAVQFCWNEISFPKIVSGDSGKAGWGGLTKQNTSSRLEEYAGPCECVQDKDDWLLHRCVEVINEY